MQTAKVKNLKSHTNQGAQSRGTEQSAQLFFHLWPLRQQNGIAYRVSRRIVSGHPMRTKYSLVPPANTFNRSPRTQITRVRVKANTKHLPCFKGERQHQQLSFSIRSGSNGGLCQPRVADLAGIRVLTAVPRVIRRPHPTLHVPEAC
jgi:hypothetical protein